MPVQPASSANQCAGDPLLKVGSSLLRRVSGKASTDRVVAGLHALGNSGRGLEHASADINSSGNRLSMTPGSDLLTAQFNLDKVLDLLQNEHASQTSPQAYGAVMSNSAGLPEEALPNGLQDHHLNGPSNLSLAWDPSDVSSSLDNGYQSQIPFDWPMNQYQSVNFTELPRLAHGDYSAQYGVELFNHGSKDSGSASTTQRTPAAEVSSDFEVDTGALIARISEINVRLFEHAATLPLLEKSSPYAPITLDSRISQRSSPAPSSGILDRNGLSRHGIPGSKARTATEGPENEFAIDRTFSLSQEFIEILQKLCPCSPDSSRRSNNPKQPPSLQKPLRSANNSENNTPRDQAASRRPLDEASGLLILSIYLRVINIYDAIFAHTQACIKERGEKSTMRLPHLAIGAFSLPPCSAMQLTLIIQLAEQLLALLREIIGSMDINVQSGNEDSANGYRQSGSGSAVLEATLISLRDREREVVKRMMHVRRLLLQTGMQ